MEITETRITLMEKPNSRLRAYASITFDNNFVVKDLRVIEGRSGLFVAMPSRRLQKPCPKCMAKNPLRAKFCGQCGAALEVATAPKEEGDSSSEHRDLAHPITTEFRNYLQKIVLEAYEKEKANPTPKRGETQKK
ncbi:MAG: septation protein SpoVG family protein [Candidatus Omnitrophica bacterium]|nr:septation protein SpoVG family protein [Candidatus Omnitrophota bacterium]